MQFYEWKPLSKYYTCQLLAKDPLHRVDSCPITIHPTHLFAISNFITSDSLAQLEALARTSVLVTPCGSLGALAVLLPPGATAVVMNYYQATTGANVQLDDAAFWNVDHVTMVYFPVGPEDYESTTVRRHTPFLACCAGGWQERMLSRCTLDESTWTAEDCQARLYFKVFAWRQTSSGMPFACEDFVQIRISGARLLLVPKSRCLMPGLGTTIGSTRVPEKARRPSIRGGGSTCQLQLTHI